MTPTIQKFILCFILICTFQKICLGQQELTNDTVCVMPGMPFMYNVTTNDFFCNPPPMPPPFCPVHLLSPSECFTLQPNGNLLFTGHLPDCCGEHELRYAYDMLQALSATIYITVKCPKPDCGFVELEPTTGGSAGGPGGKVTLNACENSVATYYFNHTTGNTYNWIVTGGSFTIVDSGIIDVTWGSMGTGMITLTVTNGTNVQTYMYCVNILDGPTAAFTPLSTNVCLNSTATFMNNSIGGTDFYWDYGDGNNSNTYHGSNVYTTPGTYTVTLYVMQTNYDNDGNPLCCCTDSISHMITVDPFEGPNIYWVSTLCEGDSSCYWTDATGCNYTWSVVDANNVPVTFTGQGNDTICLQWGQGPHGIVTLQLSNCTGNYCLQPVSVIVPIVDSNSPINGPTTVCAHSSATYNLPKWMSVEYNWMAMGGTIVSTDTLSNTITVQWGNGPTGMLMANWKSKFLQNLPGHDEDDCEGMSKINVNILPQYGLNPGPTVACVGDVSFFSTDTTAANGFTWNISPLITPFPIVGPNNISVTWPSPGLYTISVFPNAPNPFCNDTLFTLINVIQVPPPDSIIGELLICPGETHTYTGYSSAPGMKLVWSVTNGTPSSFTGNPITVTWAAGGPYSLSLSQMMLNVPGCMSAPIIQPIVKKVLNGPLVITGPNACINDVDTYSLTPVQPAGTQFTWSINPPAAGSVILGQGTPTVNIQWNNTPGSVTITADVDVCGVITPKTHMITLNAPVQPTITQIGILCPGVNAVLDAGPGFTSYLWSNAMTSQTITISGPGVYTVTTTDANGCTAIDSYEAFNVPGPVADISTADPVVLCVMPLGQTTVTLHAITNPNYTYQWYCNNTPSGTGNPLVHTNNNMVGTFAYFVVVTDNSTGCMKQSNTITVIQQLCPGGPGGGCNPAGYTLTITDMNNMPFCNDVTFTVNNINATPQSWNFGDPGGNTFTGPLVNPTHTYSKAGYFLATLYATVPNLNPPPPTCTVIATTQVVVPVAAEFTCTNMCRMFTFTDFSTFVQGETIVNYAWNFGDFNSMSGPNPVVNHTYALGGTYTVTLTVLTANGCQATFSKMINAPSDPNANFTMAPNPACVGDAIVYTPASTSGIVSFLWNFGDASTNGLAMPSHAYTSANTYNVTLTVTDVNGCTASQMNSIIIHPLPVLGPLMASDTVICQGDTVTLTADPGYVSYLWNTGATTQSIQVTMSGTYQVTVTDVNLCTAIHDSITITVIPAPIPVISGSHYICDDECITLQASTGFNYMYQWYDEVGDSLLNQTFSSIIICDSTFQDTVIVGVKDDNGCIGLSAPWAIDTANAPLVSIVLVSGDSCEGTPKVLSVNPILSYVQYYWSTGATGTGIVVSQAGTYTVLAIDTTTGCSASASITIHPLPDLCYVPVGCYIMCDNDTLCGPPGLSMYQWNKNGVPIPGATMQFYIVTMNGSYSLTGTNQFNCSATSDSLIIMVIDCCVDSNTIVTAEPIPTDGDSCCWTLSYINSMDSIFAIQITTNDANILTNAGSVDPSLSLYSTSAHSITLVSTTPGDPVPADTIINFIDLCFNNITNSPIELFITWLDSNSQVICEDTLIFECEPEPPCLYLASDSIWCDLDVVLYEMELCNPVYNTYPFSYVAVNIFSPSGANLNVTPLIISPPLQPGQCTTAIFTVTGGNFANQDLCFNLTGHETDPSIDSAALCCTLDTMYCIHIPGCDMCDSLYIAEVVPVDIETDSCCYEITIVNYLDSALIDGISICLITEGSTMTLDNPLGGPWYTTFLSETLASLVYVNPEDPTLPIFLPIGEITLPPLCVNNPDNPITQVEIKWMHGDQVVCRDTIELICSDCGFFENIIFCNDVGDWIIQGSITNNSGYTVGTAHIIFEDPAYSGFNQVINLGTLNSGSSYGPITLNIGSLGNPGDTVCVFITLHTIDHDDQHENCCAFKVLFILPDCGNSEEPCECNPEFYLEIAEGINCIISGNTVTFSPAGDFDEDCDRVQWIFLYNGSSGWTMGNESIMHTFPGPGEYDVCMIVYRSTPTEECKEKIQKQVTIFPPETPPIIYPNPVNKSLLLQLRKTHPTIRVIVYDMNGRELIDQTTSGERGDILSFSTESFAAGVYTAKIISGEDHWIRRFIKLNQ